MDDLVDQVALPDPSVLKRDFVASREQALQKRLSVLREREATRAPHAFLCHNAQDIASVIDVARILRDQGVYAWYDQADLLGGDLFTEEIEEIIGTVPAIVIAVGQASLGRWQKEEYYAALSHAVTARNQGRTVRLIPVLLPGAAGIDDLPPFLRSRSVIDLRHSGVSSSRRLAELADAILGTRR